jgi:RNA polymerase sigma-70 factor (ECF subfamily)
MPSGDETSVRVRRAAKGSGDDVAWIVDRFTPLLVANAEYRLPGALRSTVDPEDVVQDVWGIALPRLGDLTPVADRLTPVLLRFLTTTLRHVIGNLLQRRSHLVRHGIDASTSGAGSEPAADGTGVVSHVLRSERQRLVRAAIGALDEDDRAILVLRGIEQRTNDEAATALAIAPGTAAVRYHRALKRLRAALPDSVFDDLAED